MTEADLNSYVGRAKRIAHTISWVTLRNEMRAAGATSEEILYVSRFVTKGSAKEASITNPVTLVCVPPKTKPVLLFALGSKDGTDISFDVMENKLYLGKDLFANG